MFRRTRPNIAKVVHVESQIYNMETREDIIYLLNLLNYILRCIKVRNGPSYRQLKAEVAGLSVEAALVDSTEQITQI